MDHRDKYVRELPDKQHFALAVIAGLLGSLLAPTVGGWLSALKSFLIN